MAENGQFIQANSSAPFKSSNVTTPIHVDLLIHQQKQKQQQQQTVDALASRLADIAQRHTDVASPMQQPISLQPAAGQSAAAAAAPARAPNLVSPLLLDPSQIHWYYLDPQGNQQGPFDGVTMQQWYTQKYLAPDLQIRREGHSTYKTLGEFVSFIGEYQYPFSVPLPAINLPLPAAPASDFPGFSSNFLGNGSSSSTPTTSQQPAGWPVGGTDFLNGDLYSQSPFIQKEVNLFAGKEAKEETKEEVKEEAKEEPKEEHREEVKEEVEEVKEQAEEKFEEPAEPLPEPLESAAPPPSSKPKPQHVQPHVVKTSDSAKPAKKGSKTVIAPWAGATTHSSVPVKSLAEIQREEQEKKRRDDEERKRVEEQDAQLASKLALEEGGNIDGDESDDLSAYFLRKKDSSSASLPTTSTWGTSGAGNSSRQPVKSLEEIQNEEKERALAKERAEAAAYRQRSIASAIATKKQNFASSIAASNVAGESAWTIVTSKKVKSVTPVAAASSHKHPTSTLSPAVLRSVSAGTSRPSVPAALSGNSWKTVGTAVSPTAPAKPVAVSAPSTGDYSAAKQFLSWCRDQLRGLSKAVNKEDVLSIMLQLPAGSESREIIADTIYSNSSTMDGRVFASEFNKRRSKVEEYVVKQGYDFNWQELLKSNSKVNAGSSEDEWDSAFTKVVSKRNRRRN
ncbi:DEKNAAC105174 [Brettanomyces naardenensis]|uniref:DEKNAAC105174 n=1 Tax=Brettanomyces naardenensis TaxID=13370 RepID=A0A448YSP7_BRENA|nr:DEKNAAC105174 [Brettanomyces naardenensis]